MPCLTWPPKALFVTEDDLVKHNIDILQRILSSDRRNMVMTISAILYDWPEPHVSVLKTCAAWIWMERPTSTRCKVCYHSTVGSL